MSSGVKLHNRHEGDRSEYLAVYLLSKLGLVTQVPRQEDIGFDLICNLAEQDSGILRSFRHHYAVSVKSTSTPRIVLDPPESKEADPSYTLHFDWLFHLELPLILGVVNKAQQSLALYSTLPAWFLYYEKRAECGIIELVPRVKEVGDNPGVGRPKDCGKDDKAGGRKRFEVDLGYPITVISAAELQDKDLVARKKASLRRAIELGAETARFAQMHTPFFWWFNGTIPGGYVFEKTNPDGFNGGVAWWVGTCPNPEHLAKMMHGLAPGLMSSALLFKAVNRPDLLNSIAPALRLLPLGSIPPQIQQGLPEVFPPAAPV